MKKFYFYAVALVMAAGMTACGCGSNTSNNESGNNAEEKVASEEGKVVSEGGSVVAEEETVEVEAEPEDVKPTPPFRVTAVRVYHDNDKNLPISCLNPDSVVALNLPEYYKVSKDILVCDVLANGKYTGRMELYELLDKDGKKDWARSVDWTNNNKEITFNYEGKWTVTWRVVGEGSEKVYDLHREYSSLFIPEDFDYIYTDYERCKEFKSYKAYKIINVEKL